MVEDRWRGLCCCKVVEVKENDKLVDFWTEMKKLREFDGALSCGEFDDRRIIFSS